MCDETWFSKNTLSSWYDQFNNWVDSGECTAQRAGIKPFDKVVDPDAFYECLRQFLESDNGSKRERDIIFKDDDEIAGFRLGITVKKIYSAAIQGV